jgi:LPS export ABC transporter protein LptC
MGNKGIFWIIIILFYGACSLDYDAAIIADDLAKEVPNSVLYSFMNTSVRKGKPVFRLQAERAEGFDSKHEIHLQGVLFEEYNNLGEVVTQGKADRAIFYTETEDAELMGNILFYSLTEETIIYGSNLSWNNEEKTLTGKPGDEVEIRKESGTTIRGKGFSCLFKEKRFIFKEQVSGYYISDEESDEESNEESDEE